MAQPRKVGKVVRGANFQSKRERKRIRKGLIQGYVSNKVADVRVEAKERMEFYRNLRMMKLRRRKIAGHMAVLADLISGLRRDIGRVGDRETGVNLSMVDEAEQLAKDAEVAAWTAADEWYAFSRRRIYYSQEVAA